MMKIYGKYQEHLTIQGDACDDENIKISRTLYKEMRVMMKIYEKYQEHLTIQGDARDDENISKISRTPYNTRRCAW